MEGADNYIEDWSNGGQVISKLTTFLFDKKITIF